MCHYKPIGHVVWTILRFSIQKSLPMNALNRAFNKVKSRARMVKLGENHGLCSQFI